MPLNLGELDGTRTIGKSLQLRQGSFALSRRAEFSYYVISDTLTDSENDIYETDDIPQLYDVVDGKTCTKVEAKETNRVVHPVTGVAAVLYEVQIEFTSEPSESEQQQPGNQTPPEDRDPQFRWSSDTEVEVPERDTTGRAILTLVGEKIILEDVIAIPVLSITTWTISPFPPLTILNLVNHVNSDPYFGAPKGSAICKSIRTEPERIAVGDVTILYDKVTAEVAFKMKRDENGQFMEDTWQPQVLHQGFQYFEADLVTKRTNKVDGEPKRINLDNDGRPVVPGGGGTTEFFLKFLTKGYVNFNDYKVLGIAPQDPIP